MSDDICALKPAVITDRFRAVGLLWSVFCFMLDVKFSTVPCTLLLDVLKKAKWTPLRDRCSFG